MGKKIIENSPIENHELTISNLIKEKESLIDKIKKLEDERKELQEKIKTMQNEFESLQENIKATEKKHEKPFVQEPEKPDLEAPLYKPSDIVMYPSKNQKLKFKVSKYQGHSKHEGHLYRISNHEFDISFDLVPEKLLTVDLNRGFENAPQSVKFKAIT